jgi:hypothetical protein
MSNIDEERAWAECLGVREMGDDISNLQEENRVLLHALKTVVASAHPHPVEHPTMTAAWAHARVVIAKAEGRES